MEHGCLEVIWICLSQNERVEGKNTLSRQFLGDILPSYLVYHQRDTEKRPVQINYPTTSTCQVLSLLVL